MKPVDQSWFSIYTSLPPGLLWPDQTGSPPGELRLLLPWSSRACVEVSGVVVAVIWAVKLKVFYFIFFLIALVQLRLRLLPYMESDIFNGHTIFCVTSSWSCLRQIYSLFARSLIKLPAIWRMSYLLISMHVYIPIHVWKSHY